MLCFAGCASERNTFVAVTWNLRGYPEKEQANRQWFHRQLVEMNPEVLCVQEIADQDKVNQFLAVKNRFAKVAFRDSDDGQDNAIFCTTLVGLEDIPDPEGFQHPAQAAYISYNGFDAVVVAVHLSWTNVALREKEKSLLRNVVSEMLKKDPDVIIVGDFNTEEEGIEQLAQSLGMSVMVPFGQNGIGTTHAGHRYDHFLVSQDLANEEAVGCQIKTFGGDDLETAKKVSDHLPVLAEFRTDSRFRDRK
jgi:endonuclease/exonuclease/phosphatase family metal-dependent hydrolase